MCVKERRHKDLALPPLDCHSIVCVHLGLLLTLGVDVTVCLVFKTGNGGTGRQNRSLLGVQLRVCTRVGSQLGWLGACRGESSGKLAMFGL